ncbi:beta strand repeat-containing protein [Luteolibacter soli]|uniref:Autotransporter-associated beta strand repeat-containing protein n=1 Tax=Luteolibacter soli TaxID=3135280 RepID=A0ABU9AVM5_9BACT
MKTRALPFVIVCLSAHSASAVNAIWDGGAATAGWGQANNWDPNAIPTFNNTLDVYFYKAGTTTFLTNFIGAGRTIRSLNFTDDADSAVSVRLVDGSNVAQTLTFDTDAGSAAITVTSGATGAHTIGDTGTVNLNDPLLITHDGTGTLTISRPIIESVSGMSLTKGGTGKLVLSAANTYTGLTTINGGILQCGVLNALGGNTQGTVVNPGGTLDINDKRLPFAETISIAGNGAGGIGALYSATGNTGDANHFGGLTLTADASIGAPSGVRYGVGANGTSVTSGLFKLTKVGLGQFDLRGQVTVGDILVSEGVLQAQGAATYNTGYNLTINTGTEFRAFELTNPFARNIVLNGGKFSSTGSLATGDLVTSPILITGAGLLDSSGDATDKVTFSGNITESAPGANLTIGGTRRVVLTGTNSYTGTTTVNSTLQASGSFTSNINVSPAATLDGEGSTTGTLTLGSASNLRFDPTTTGAGQNFRAADVIVAPFEIVNVIANSASSGSGIVVLHDNNGGLDLSNFMLLNPGRATLALGGAGGNSDLIYNFQAANLEWHGYTNSDWSIEDTNKNFLNLGTSLHDDFFTRDNVDFVNAATGTVTLIASLSPGNVAFKNTAGNNLSLVPFALETFEPVSISKTSTGDVTIASSIIGTGGISMTSTAGGTLFLTANNTATGAITVDAGTLQIGNGGTTGSIAAPTVANNGSVVVNRTDNVTIASLISGSGTLTQAGTGTAILSQDNTYTGLTTVSAGTLQIGANGTTGNLAGNILDNANVEFNRSNNFSYGGSITGSGSVTKRGLGNMTLTGTNTFGGGLNLYNAITTAADANVGSGPITMGPGLANTNTLAIAGGTIDNDIYFADAGTGNKIINIATGFTDAGLSGTIHLDANSGVAAGVSRISTDFGTLVISGKMTGAGTNGYSKRQNGHVVITNNTNDYTGPTHIVDGGALVVDGRVPGNVFFGELPGVGGTGAMNGTLAGSGTIGGNVKLQAPSKLSPGGTSAAGVLADTRATLTINGNLEADQIGTGAGRIVMQLGAPAGTNDRVNVGGTLSLGAGTIGLNEFTITDAGGLAAGVYTLIHTTGGITGTLDAANVTASVGASLNGTLSISGTDLILTVAGANPYATWTATFPTLTNTAFDFDFDNDGIATGLEWVLGGNPTVNDTAAIAPTFTGSAATGITMSFKREEDSIGAVTVTVEYGTTLATWPGSVAIGAASSGPDGNGVTVNVNAVPDPDNVTVTIPASNAGGSGRLYARLKATMP